MRQKLGQREWICILVLSCMFGSPHLRHAEQGGSPVGSPAAAEAKNHWTN